MGILEEYHEQEAYYEGLVKISKPVLDEETKQLRQELEKAVPRNSEKIKMAKMLVFCSEVIYPFCKTLEYIRRNKKWDIEFFAKLILSDGTETFPEGNAYDLYDRIAVLPVHWKNIFISVFNSVSVRCSNAIVSGNSKQDFVEGCASLDTTVFNKILYSANMFFYSFDMPVETYEDISLEDSEGILKLYLSKFSLSSEQLNPITKFIDKSEKIETSLSDCIEFLKFYVENAGIPIWQLDKRERNILVSILKNPLFVYETLACDEYLIEIDFSYTPILVKELKSCWKEKGNLIKLANFVVMKKYIEVKYRDAFLYLFSGDPNLVITDERPCFSWHGELSDIMFIVKRTASQKVDNCYRNLLQYIELKNDDGTIGSELPAWMADRPGKDIKDFFSEIEKSTAPKECESKK